MFFPVSHIPIIDKYRGEYTNAELVIDKKNRIFVKVQVDVPEKEVIKKEPENIKVIGIDGGIKNIAVLSNNVFFNSKHLREVKGRYQYLKRKLQHLGTCSANRKLRKIAGRERRFVLYANYVISKKVESLPYDVIALEALEAGKMKRNGKGKKFRRKLELQSPAELAEFIEYKAGELGKKVIYVNQKHTLQKSSIYEFTGRNNRNESVFKCKNCSFQLNMDMDASKNIEVLSKSEYLTHLSTNHCGTMKFHSWVGWRPVIGSEALARGC